MAAVISKKDVILYFLLINLEVLQKTKPLQKIWFSALFQIQITGLINQLKMLH